MFEQYVGSGADLFITIVALLIGFISAIAVLDLGKTKQEEKE